MRSSQCRWIALVVFALAAVAVAAAQVERPRRHRSRAEKPEVVKPAERGQQPTKQVKLEPARRRAPRNVEIAVFSLKHAEAEHAAAILGHLSRAFDGLMVCPDERTNTLLVAAESEHTLTRVREMVEAIDQPARVQVPEGHRYENVRLEHAVAEEVVEYLRRLAPRTPALRYVGDERANTVWLAGPQDLVAQAVELVRSIEETTAAAGTYEHEDSPKLCFYDLEHADSPRLAGTINQIVETMNLDIHVVADPASGILAAHATPEENELLEQIITRLDVRPRQVGKAAPPAKRGGRRGAARDDQLKR